MQCRSCRRMAISSMQLVGCTQQQYTLQDVQDGGLVVDEVVDELWQRCG